MAAIGISFLVCCRSRGAIAWLNSPIQAVPAISHTFSSFAFTVSFLFSKLVHHTELLLIRRHDRVRSFILKPHCDWLASLHKGNFKSLHDHDHHVWFALGRAAKQHAETVCDWIVSRHFRGRYLICVRMSSMFELGSVRKGSFPTRRYQTWQLCKEQCLHSSTLKVGPFPSI